MRALPFLIAGLIATCPAAAGAGVPAWLRVPPPDIALAGGSTFSVSGEPSGGGASFAAAALWPIAARARFGVQAFVDDMGTELVQLYDPNFGTPLGTAADLHRWAWGAAWRAETDLWSRGSWAGGASGALGLWRIEDDRRGDHVAAGSAVGLRVGADARRPFGRGREIGVALAYNVLDQHRSSAWRRVERYASVALEFRWRGPGSND